jgi:hypothetical protein
VLSLSTVTSCRSRRKTKDVVSNNPIDAKTECLSGRGLDSGTGAKQPMTLASGSLGAMPPLSYPLRFVLVALAGWMNQGQREVLEYLQEENRVLREPGTQASAVHG